MTLCRSFTGDGSMNTYQAPEYFEIAFSFRDTAKEVDFFEAAIKRYSKIPVRSVFELASGSCPYLEEWHRRGYRFSRFDASPQMIASARRHAAGLGADATLLRGNMAKFAIRSHKFDFAYVALGSLYVRSNREMLTHLASLARVLRPGALYLLDGVVRFNIVSAMREQWTIRRGGVTVKTTYRPELIDPLEQLCTEHVVMEVNDHGRRMTLDSGLPRKIFFAQELVMIARQSGSFEFVDWFSDFRFRKNRDASGRHIVILRRTNQTKR